MSSCVSPVEVVLPLADSELEVVPGLWSRDQAEGYVYVTPKEDEKYVQEGEEVAVAVKAVAEQQFCRSCGHFDAVAWTGGQNCCSECECPAAGFRKMSPECQRCGEMVFRSELGGCQKKVKGSSSRGCSGVALLLADLLCFVAAGVVSSDKVYHIVETPGALDLLAEEGPTDKYYQRLRADLSERYPAASEHLLDHLEALEAFLDKSIHGRSHVRDRQGQDRSDRRGAPGPLCRKIRSKVQPRKDKGCSRLSCLTRKVAHSTVLGLYEFPPELLASGVCALR